MLDPIRFSRSAGASLLDRGGASANQDQGLTDPFARQLLSLAQKSIERMSLRGSKARTATVESASPLASSSVAKRQDQDTVSAGATAQLLKPLNGSRLNLPPSCTEPASRADGVIPVPEGMYEDHPGWNARCFATEETAMWLAQRVGGEVGTFQWQWTLGFEQPPQGYTVRFGDQEINAGALAMYFEPGRFVNPDQEAAAALYRAGIINDYVRQNWSALMDGDPPAA